VAYNLSKEKQVAVIAALAEGNVEVLDLIGHPKAAQGYAWGYQDDAGKWQCVAVLKVSPVDSPRMAVQAYILTQPR
jgi:hypothetical protein